MGIADVDLQTVEVAVDGPVGRLWLNRPDKLNPLSTRTLEEIAAAATAFDDEPGVKVVIIAGRGRAFTAGADLGAFTGSVDDGLTPRQRADRGRIMAEAVEGMRAVTIAAIHGHCVGGGVVLAAACDLRVAAEDARFSIPEVDLGIPLAWGGIPRLVREVGPAFTRELVMTCRPFDAAEAHRLRFVNRVVPARRLEEEVTELARSLAARSALTLEATKRHVAAVCEQMVGTAHAWADADGLVAAQHDPESREVARAYLERFRRR